MKKLLTLAALAAGLSLAGVAAAEPGTGATVVDDEYCIGSPFATWCWDVKTITKVTTTPSGNVSYVTNGTIDNTISLPFSGCTHTKLESMHLHWLKKAGVEQSHSQRLEQTTAFVCSSGSAYSCTSTFELHMANGEVQFQRPEFDCTNG
jgi:hypothetical protein